MARITIAELNGKIAKLYKDLNGSGGSIINEIICEYLTETEVKGILLKVLLRSTTARDMVNKYIVQAEDKQHYEMCEDLYQRIGMSAVINYANKFNLPYRYCKGCECETPSGNPYGGGSICFICGQSHKK